jgi:ETC complex I subunit conserved region
MTVRIYRPARTAMQAGRAGTKAWIVEFEARGPLRPDPLMGWTSTLDTETQVRLRFESRDDAVRYAREHGLDYEIEMPNERSRKSINYSDNYAFDRKIPFTH